MSVRQERSPNATHQSGWDMARVPAPNYGAPIQGTVTQAQGLRGPLLIHRRVEVRTSIRPDGASLATWPTDQRGMA